MRFPLRPIDIEAALGALNLSATRAEEFVVTPTPVRAAVQRSVDCEYFRLEHLAPTTLTSVDVPATAPHSLHALAGAVSVYATDGMVVGRLARGESALVPIGVGAYRVVADRGARARRQSGAAAVCELKRRLRRCCGSISTRSRAITGCCASEPRRRNARPSSRRTPTGSAWCRLRAGCCARAAGRFFVATLGEVAELRALAPDAEIYVLEGAVLGAVDELVALRAVPVLSSLEQIERWQGHGRALLHIDTGMTRLGLSAADVRVLAGRRELLEGVELEYVITHLACADEPEHPQNRAQLAVVRRAAPTAAARREPRSAIRPARCSTRRIAAISFVPASRCTAATRSRSGRTRWPPVVTFLAPILQIREIAAPVTVGYGATYVAEAARAARGGRAPAMPTAIRGA